MAVALDVDDPADRDLAEIFGPYSIHATGGRGNREMFGIHDGTNRWFSATHEELSRLREAFAADGMDVAGAALAGGASVVIEWGTWHRDERERLLLHARSRSARAELHLLHAPLDVLYDRVRGRARQSPSIGRQDLEEWSRELETPTAGEASEWDRFVEINAGWGSAADADQPPT